MYMVCSSTQLDSSWLTNANYFPQLNSRLNFITYGWSHTLHLMSSYFGSILPPLSRQLGLAGFICYRKEERMRQDR